MTGRLNSKQEKQIIRTALSRKGMDECMDGDLIRELMADELGIDADEVDYRYHRELCELADGADIIVRLPNAARGRKAIA